MQRTFTPSTMAERIELVDINILIPFEHNARTHSSEQVDQIIESIREFGFTNPILVDESKGIIAGHGRLAAARKIGMASVPVVELKGLTEYQKRAYILADNKLALNAGWDDALLAKELEWLDHADFDLSVIGFSDDELADLLPDDSKNNSGDGSEDDVPEVPQNIHGVKRGDIWQLGDHRLACGDSTSKDDVDRLMNGEKADMVFTDPPYGMNLETDYGSKGQKPTVHGNITAQAKNYAPVIGDDKDFDAKFIFEFFGYCDEIFLFGADYYLRSIPCGGAWEGSWFVWDKNCGESADKMHGSAFELCWSKQRHKRQILRIRSGIYGAKDDSKKRVHPTQKLVQVPMWFLEEYSDEKSIIVDLFLGSGSTLIACEKTGRKCRGLEIDEHYCSVIIERWQKFSGKQAQKLEQA